MFTSVLLLSFLSPACTLPSWWLICIIKVLRISKHNFSPIQVDILICKLQSTLLMCAVQYWLGYCFWVLQGNSPSFSYPLYSSSTDINLPFAVFKQLLLYLFGSSFLVNQSLLYPLCMSLGKFPRTTNTASGFRFRGWRDPIVQCSPSNFHKLAYLCYT